MKNLLLLCFVTALLAAIPAHAQFPTIFTAICDTNIEGVIDYVSINNCSAADGPGFLVEAGVGVLGQCTSGQTPVVALTAWAACSYFRPVAAAAGAIWPGVSTLSVGSVNVAAVLNGVPGSPSATQSSNCWNVVSVSGDPIGPC